MNNISHLAKASAVVLASLILSACGSSGGGGGASNAGQQTGQFIDSPVDGLGYKATPSGITGTTENGGFFKFEAGDSIVFTVAGVDLPEVSAGGLISPNSFGDGNEPLNVGLLLLSLDEDNNPDNGITISATGLAGVIDLTQDNADFLSALQSLAGDAGLTLNSVDAAAVQAHFDKQCWQNNSCVSLVKSDEVVKTLKVYGNSSIALDADNGVLYFSVNEFDKKTDQSTIYQYSLNGEGKINKASEKVIIGNQPLELSTLTYNKEYLYATFYDGNKVGVKVYSTQTSDLVQDFIVVEDGKLYNSPVVRGGKIYLNRWSNGHSTIISYDLDNNGEIIRETESILLTASDGEDFSGITFDNNNLYVAARQNTVDKETLFIKQYAISSGLVSLTSELPVFFAYNDSNPLQNDKSFVEPYGAELVLVDDKLLVAIDADRTTACTYVDEDDDSNEECDSSIGWLYSVDIKGDALINATALTQAEVSFYGGFALASNKKSVFASYNRNKEHANGAEEPEQVGIMQFDLIKQK